MAQEGGRAFEQQSGVMKAQSLVARNSGYRGWRHEGAVAFRSCPFKEITNKSHGCVAAQRSAAQESPTPSMSPPKSYIHEGAVDERRAERKRKTGNMNTTELHESRAVDGSASADGELNRNKQKALLDASF